MKKRRGRNEGSIFQEGKKWVAQVSLGIGPTGRRQVFKKRCATKREAQDALREMKARHYPLPSTTTLGDLLTAWFRDIVPAQVEPRTLEEYQGTAKKHIIPFLGRNRLQTIDAPMILKWQAQLKAGAVTKKKSLAILRQALDHARTAGLIDANPAAAVKPPVVRPKIRTALTLPQIDAYLKAAETHRLGLLVILAIVTAMREGELLGLQWEDVDWKAGAILATHAWKRGKKGAYYLGPITKSDRGRRRIDLPKFAVDALKRHRTAMKNEGHGSSFVFCSSAGTGINPSNLLERFHYPMLDTAKLPKVTFHDLRHTAATLLFALDVHPKVAQERLGHSTSKITMDLYSHAVPSMQRDAADRLDAFFERRKP